MTALPTIATEHVEPTVRVLGEEISLARIIQHYRRNAHAEPHRARFWNTLTRTVIAEYRETAADPHRKAA